MARPLGIDYKAEYEERRRDTEMPTGMKVGIQGKGNFAITAKPGSTVNIYSDPRTHEDGKAYAAQGATAGGNAIGSDDLIRFSDLSIEPSSKQQLRLVLVGHTGGGKSETGNSILCDRERSAFESLPFFGSVTTNCQTSSGKDIRSSGNADSKSREIVVVDTPGLFDTDADPDDIAKEITQCILHVLPGPHAILMVISISRLTNEIRQAVDGLRSLFGDRSIRYMIVVFTHLDDIKRKKSITGIDQVIRKGPPALGKILQLCNNRYVAFDNTLDPESKENKKQVSNLLDLVDSVVESNSGRCYTNDLLDEATRLMEIEKKKYDRESKDREIQIRAEYDKHLTEIAAKQHELVEVTHQLEAQLQRAEQLQQIYKRVQQLQQNVNDKEQQLAAMAHQDTYKALELESLKRSLTTAIAEKTRVDTEKYNLEQRKQELEEGLIKENGEKERLKNYLSTLEALFQKETKKSIKFDPSNPPEQVVKAVKHRLSKWCRLL